MGFDDRRYGEAEGGGIRGSLRRMFTSGGGFFSWSFPLFTVPRGVPGIGGIRVRVHILFVLIAVGQLIEPLLGQGAGGGFLLRHVAARMATLFLLVLLHEFGHCVACRAVGGDADEVLMWPLGGLAYCRPPLRWQAALITTLGGPGVNVVLMPVLGGVILAAGGQWTDVVFNPFKPSLVNSHGFFNTEWHWWLWSAYYMNLMLLAFNMLVPMYPMDCGKVVQEILWWRIGYKRSMLIAVKVGLFGAVVLAGLGLWQWNLLLVGVAIFGGSTCYSELVRLRTVEDDPPWAFDTDKGYQAAGFDDTPGAVTERARQKSEKAAAKRAEKERQTTAEVDRILDKIRVEGLASLSAKEKAVLQRATEESRGKR